jgi:hypothetical protein
VLERRHGLLEIVPAAISIGRTAEQSHRIPVGVGASGILVRAHGLADGRLCVGGGEGDLAPVSARRGQRAPHLPVRSPPQSPDQGASRHGQPTYRTHGPVKVHAGGSRWGGQRRWGRQCRWGRRSASGGGLSRVTCCSCCATSTRADGGCEVRGEWRRMGARAKGINMGRAEGFEIYGVIPMDACSNALDTAEMKGEENCGAQGAWIRSNTPLLGGWRVCC